MSKAKKVIAAAVIFLVAAAIITVGIINKLNKLSKSDTSEFDKSGIVSENGSNVLHIHDYVHDSTYGNSRYNILENDETVSIENLGGCGWNLIPQKSGHCGIAVDEYWVDYLGTYIYDITVGEDLKISYAVRDAWKYPLYNHSLEQVTVQNGDNSAVILDKSNLLKELNALYGRTEYSDTAPNLSNCVKITCTCVNDECDYDLYVLKDRIYYFNENEKNWEEFTPDEFCSLDGINELLDIKD